MAAVKTSMEQEEIERIELAEIELVEPKRELVKISDNLYIPSDFEKDHNYYADAEGTKRYYGITTVLGVVAKPALIPWAARLGVETLSALVIEGVKMGMAAEEIVEALEKWSAEASSAHTKRKEQAGLDGTNVHEEIEKLIKVAMEVNNGKIEAFMLNDALPEQVKEFAQWAILNDVKFLASEQRLCSQKLFVAGTADFICEKGGELFIGDIKTNNSGIYPEHHWQATAYAFMAREMGLYKNFKGTVIVNVPKRGGIKVQENYDLKGNFQVFKGALQIFKAKEGQKVKKLKK